MWIVNFCGNDTFSPISIALNYVLILKILVISVAYVPVTKKNVFLQEYEFDLRVAKWLSLFSNEVYYPINCPSVTESSLSRISPIDVEKYHFDLCFECLLPKNKIM